MQRIFLDYASATPVRREVKRAMEKFLSDEFYNPSAIYAEATKPRQALEEAREVIARAVKAGKKDVVFTSGGTEADNLAILGTFEAAKAHVSKTHIIVCKSDHPAILEAAREVERRGGEVSVVSVEEIVHAIKDTTVLVSLSLCSSETGELVPAARIGRAIREKRKLRQSTYPYFHLDASQAIVSESINVDALHADLISLDAGKIEGPKGVGALVVRPGVEVRPILLGGGQERGLRSGTENIPGIVGFAKALELLETERHKNVDRFVQLKTAFLNTAREIPSIQINGGEEAVPHIVSVTIPGKLHEFLAILLDEHGVMVSTGSACSSRKDEPDKEAMRFSFCRETTKKEVEKAARILREIVL